MEIRERIESYLVERLVPFWLDRVADPDGGFLTYFDRNGRPTGQTDKTLIQQTRTLFMLSLLERSGRGAGRAGKLAAAGLDFLLEKFWDKEQGGWFWITDRGGRPLQSDKIVYGQSFAIYALSEYALAVGDRRAADYAVRTFDLLQKYAADTAFGGYREMFRSDWSPRPGGDLGGDRKSFDVHMHLMEAFTSLCELTGREIHRRKLREVVRVLWERMLDPASGTGIAQFELDFRPRPAISFRTVWGSDRDHGGRPRPLDNTSYGHNIEFFWLLLRSLEALGEPAAPYRARLRRLVEHTRRYGLDERYGGLYVEGRTAGPARDRQKEFWQQAEALVGFLDAYLLFGERPYWEAFRNIFDFVWTKVINHQAGEWYALLDRRGRVRWDYLGHAWKNNYHTVRSMTESLKRLERIQGRPELAAGLE
ncbi:MAG TPA: AGE family epimerase/isomerase [bacterium]|uniref:Cellobiose 2-epimerase n=1 Tax=candidate division TA06 bacterium ADurb.Bin417 TaxID=1852828 RepID=A0A1V5MB15_UNCT6|nr:MAG: Cellobiose 2-epimerase [candidate division TA06 bacterium ADurb.Bin417]HNQ35667.1 AGE family epimerase/isomerase [bacterium]HNS48568.1 AGE family epimerase/isomerase [bacterium]